MAPCDFPGLGARVRERAQTRRRGFGFESVGYRRFHRVSLQPARLVQIYFHWRPTLPDPDDDRILEVAVRTGSPIVTFNVRDFRESESFGIRTLSPHELLTTMGDKR